MPIEIKASSTPHPDRTRGLARFRRLSQRDQTIEVARGTVVYGGAESRSFGNGDFVPWMEIEPRQAELE